MYQAIKKNKLKEITSLLNNGTDVNAPLWKTGEFAGYTALHVACMENKDNVVESLVSDYKANVNLVADDGTLPIHLACFYEDYIPRTYFNTDIEKLQYLLQASANADVEFGREIFTKHVKNKEWCPDFGEKMTLLTYTIVYKKPTLACSLIGVSSDLKIKSLKNKTLLMYALEYGLHHVATDLMDAIEDPGYINLRDDDGIPTIHHVLYPKKYNQFRYNLQKLELKILSQNDEEIMMELIEAGADKYALVNGDPATFLPNIAAYKGCSQELKGLLSCYESMPLSKILYNAMLPIDDNLNKMVRLNPTEKPNVYPFFMERIPEQRQKTIEVALKDLIFRRTFGLHSNKEEIQLMENLIATDKKIKSIVDNFKRNFINGELKSHFIDINGKKISLLNFMKLIFDRKKLKLWASDETSCKWCLDINLMNPFYDDYYWLNDFSYDKIENGCKRYKLLEKLDQISALRKYIDLPYEIVLEFIEYYLNNDDFNAFINAFIC